MPTLPFSSNNSLSPCTYKTTTFYFVKLNQGKTHQIDSTSCCFCYLAFYRATAKALSPSTSYHAVSLAAVLCFAGVAKMQFGGSLHQSSVETTDLSSHTPGGAWAPGPSPLHSWLFPTLLNKILPSPPSPPPSRVSSGCIVHIRIYPFLSQDLLS